MKRKVTFTIESDGGHVIGSTADVVLEHGYWRREYREVDPYLEWRAKGEGAEGFGATTLDAILDYLRNKYR